MIFFGWIALDGRDRSGWRWYRRHQARTPTHPQRLARRSISARTGRWAGSGRRRGARSHNGPLYGRFEQAAVLVRATAAATLVNGWSERRLDSCAECGAPPSPALVRTVRRLSDLCTYCARVDRPQPWVPADAGSGARRARAEGGNEATATPALAAFVDGLRH
jgi:hypothetical protein